ncbi:MAG: riboflavin biosynthesis protein RibF [Synergistes sp.]|nr:riboflavin biosynthesis protein RibF [Synergistes sp.]
MIYALGAFDGFHLGHRELLREARRISEEKGCGWGVMTFEGHPRMFLAKDGFRLLFNSREKDLIASALGVPVMKRIKFTSEIAALAPDEFVKYAVQNYSASGFVIGENFRFGRGRSGDAAMMTEICKMYGLRSSVVKRYVLDGITVSSTETRKYVQSGNVDMACRMLGYPYIISGVVSHGEGRGTKIGCSTANLDIDSAKVYPPYGVYAAAAHIDGLWRAVSLNIGANPTFGEGIIPRCEAHIIDYTGDLYDRHICVFAVKRLRAEEKFSNADALIARIAKDNAECYAISCDYILRDSKKEKILNDFAALL